LNSDAATDQRRGVQQKDWDGERKNLTCPTYGQNLGGLFFFKKRS